MTVHADNLVEERTQAGNAPAYARKPLGVVRSEAPASAAAAELLVVAGHEQGQRFRLAGGTVLAGRAERADLRLTDPLVDAEHLRFVHEHDTWVVQSIDGRALHVNDLRTTEYALRDGDRVRVGRTVLKLLTGGDVDVRSVEESFRATVVDAVTRVWTRPAMIEALRVELDYARRFSLPLSVLVLKLGGFDSPSADDVVRFAGSRVKTLLARQDRIGRLDERTLAVVLPRTPETEASALGVQLVDGLGGSALQTEHAPVTLHAAVRIGTPASGTESAEQFFDRLLG